MCSSFVLFFSKNGIKISFGNWIKVIEGEIGKDQLGTWSMCFELKVRISTCHHRNVFVSRVFMHRNKSTNK